MFVLFVRRKNFLEGSEVKVQDGDRVKRREEIFYTSDPINTDE